VGGSRALALISALALAFNPLYLDLSCTFMTDVPFVAVAIFSLLLVTVGLRRSAWGTIMGGAVVAAGASLIRQFGLVVPCALALSALFSRRRGRDLARTGAFFALAALPLVGWCVWLAHSQGYQRIRDMIAGPATALSGQGPGEVAGRIHACLLNAFMIGMYLGLLTLPLVVVKGRRSLTRNWVFLAAAAVFLLGSLSQRRLMPFGADSLGANTIGPLFLSGSEYLVPKPLAGIVIWAGLTLAAALAAAFLLALVVDVLRGSLRREVRTEPDAEVRRFLIWCAIIYAAPLVAGGFYDRYVLLLVPLMTTALCAGETGAGAGQCARWRVGAAGLLLAGFAVFSVAATHDHLAWNRARWEALDHLMQAEHVSPDRISGGFEFNGAYTYNPKEPMKPWRWVVRDDYIVAFRPLPKTQVYSTWPYERWLPPMRDQIYVLTHAQPGAP
jgi:4-amino-4-deoxy-L-arabinose transferase-like glycosyltransferase